VTATSKRSIWFAPRDITERKNSQAKIERLALYRCAGRIGPTESLFREKVEESLARLRRVGNELPSFSLISTTS